MRENIKQNITRSGIWMRLIYMIVLAIAFNVAEFVIVVVVVFQFLSSLFSGVPNDRLVQFSRNLARYVQQIIAFLTFVTEEKPFPFAPWPDQAPAKSVAVKSDDGRAKNVNTTDASSNANEKKAPKKRTVKKSPTAPRIRKKPTD